MNLKKIETIMEKGYDLNIVALLYVCKQGEPIDSVNSKIQAIVAMMERKGLILEGRITASGEELLKCIEEGEEIIKEREKIHSYDDIYEKVLERVEKLTGKRQVRSKIYGKEYNYLPVQYDFVTRLKKVANKYKLSDIEKLEKVILWNIEICHKTGKWYPLLLYYFSKTVDGQETSTLAADYEGWDEQTKKVEQEYDGTNI